MNSLQNPWDLLGEKTFNTHLKAGKIDPAAADNILIAWPSLLKLIAKEYPDPKNSRVLDFGCGTGGFCNKLDSLGFDVTGVDPSIEMTNIAKQHSPSAIKYIRGDQSKLSSLGTFHIITSIMTLPFIKNINETFNSISKALKANGVFIFASFNPQWVKACLNSHVAFTDFDSIENPKNGWKTFSDGIKIPVYIRNSNEYDDLAKKNGLTKITEEYPPYNEEFKKYIKRY
ncbi:class I SAM-dependent methyltransferase, partial [Candidatus Roizmanbacteria bacterium]|nr:class I SAM-dependent methyltransferase [Candidatus Roizmanbacteria bacterium]